MKSTSAFPYLKLSDCDEYLLIIDNVWKESDEIPFDRVIDVYVKELRKKLELDCIVTIRNVGYKLERK